MSLTITIPGAVDVTTGSTAPATLTIGVGVPGAQGPQGPAGPGVPAGGTAGQYLQKIDGTNYNTDWVTLNLSSYLTTASAASTYQTLAGMSSYLTTSAAASSYYPLSGNPSGFLTSSALTGYATQSWVSAGFAPLARAVPSAGTTGQVLTKNSGTDYDASWATFVPGDRYLTTSSTSNTIGNGTKTFTVGTGLSYTTQQDVVISYDASNHMHALVTSYNSGTGVLVVDVNHHTGSGTYTSWTVNVGGTTPLQSVEWGEILGTLGDQTDLSTALNAKLSSATAATTYAALAGATFTGEVVTPASTTSNAGLTITPGTAPSSPTNGEIWATTTDLQVCLNGVTETIAEQSWVTAQGYLTSAPVTSVAGKTGAVSLVVGDVSGAAALAGATFTGLVGTVASTTTTAGLNIPHGAAPTTPVNGDVWSTTGGLFWRQNGSTKQAMNLGDTQTVSGNVTFSNANGTFGSSTAAGTINVGTGATISGSTKAINIGTAGVSGSTTNVAIGSSVSGAGVSVTVNGSLTTTGVTQNIGNSTAASTINIGTGATISGSTKAVNIGTAGVAGSTTNIAIGSTTGTSTTTLQGTTNGVTQSVGTNNTTLATTAFVIGQAGTGTPLMNGVGASGTSFSYSRNDHVHPTDTSRAPLASPTFTGTVTIPAGASISGFAPLASPALTGTPTAPTATTGTNTTQVATTAFVQQEVPAASTTAAGKVELATTDEALRPSSSTLGMTPDTTREMLMYPGYIQMFGAGNYATSGAGATNFTNGSNRWTAQRSPNATVAGYAMYIFDYSFTGIGMAAMTRGVTSLGRRWNNRIWASGRTVLGQWAETTSGLNGDANCTARVMVGGRSSAGTGGMQSTEPGIGWRVAGGGSVALVMTVSNGTTLTETTSSFTPVLGEVFDWKMYSDGTGNVTLWVNDSQVATSTGGPTTSTTENLNFYCQVVEQTASAATPFAMGNFGTKVFWSPA